MEDAQTGVIEHSEDENEMNLVNTTKVRKKSKIIDSSDSENEETLDNVKLTEEIDENEEVPTLNKKKLNRIAMVNSDSEDEDLSKENVETPDNINTTEKIDENEEIPTLNKKKLKRIAVIDSDSEDEEVLKDNEIDGVLETVNESSGSIHALNDQTNNDYSDVEDVVDEEEVTPHNKSFPDEESAVEAVIYTTNKKSELIKENTSIKNSSLSRLCDSESEEEFDNNDVVESSLIEPAVEPKIYKKTSIKKGQEKPKQMTAKEAAAQRSEIRAESQRMLRETNVSLPYHTPRSYTIKEFLQKRSKLSSVLSHIPKAPPSVAIKMSKDQLKEVSKKYDERIKEVKEFYKSESEEEEDEDDPTKEIRSWLGILVDNAVDTVEEKNKNLSVEVVEDETEHDKSADNSKEQDSLEYDFNLDDVIEPENKKLNISELIKDKLNIQPKLSGTPDDIIDLQAGVTRISEVKQLVDKFFRHTAKKATHKHKVRLNVLEVGSHGEIIKQTVSMNVDEEEEHSLVETPGAKLQKLKEELQEQMAQKRLELWKQKHEQGEGFVGEKKPDYEEGPEEKDILDDEEEEFEMTESEEEDEDDEEECDAKPEKRKSKSAFLDDEAEDDEDVEDEEVSEEKEPKSAVAEDEADEDEDIDGEDPDDQVSENEDGDTEDAPEKEELQSPKKKVLKRIIKPFSVDSDDEDEQQTQDNAPTNVLKYYTTDDDDFIPPNLPRVGKTPQRTQLDKSKSEFDFLTPVTYLTGLQNLSTDSKFLQDSPNSPFDSPYTSQEISSQSSQVQKNLFSENMTQSQNSQEKIDDLLQLCSGTFPETQQSQSAQKSLEQDELPSTQDLLNLCSGDFSTGITKPSEEVETSTRKAVLHVQTNSEEEIKNLDDEQDQIISQLLDEDELERFKKKFESPVNPIIRKSIILDDVEEVNATGLIDSDDENEELEIRTKKRKKIVFSDDEDEEEIENGENVNDEDESEEEERDNEEEIDLADIDDEEQQLENEIRTQGSHNYKLSDFFDEEAELSESDWGSADEDEKGLDELEAEQGDEEKFNENKIRTEIERIHMRQLLDDDNREVKLLQELLLEDGELHGTGRKRQFRWKTLDSADNAEFEKRTDDDIFLDEEENEEEWRKMRYKREMFLKKKSDSGDVDNILSDSQILKIGQHIFKTKSLNSTPVNKTGEESTEPFKLLTKRGSFLSRNDQVLQRLAEYNKVTTSVASTSKNSKNFVFQTVETSERVVQVNNNKRKATESTPNVIKKLRLNDLSPAIGAKNKAKGSKAKKLFGNW